MTDIGGIELAAADAMAVLLKVSVGELSDLLGALVEIDTDYGSHPHPPVRALGRVLVDAVAAVPELRESALGAIAAELAEVLPPRP